MATLALPTLQQLITETRSLLNQPDQQNSFWSDIELTNWLNEGGRLYFSELVQANEGQFVATADLDITANTDTIALPSNFFAARIVYKKINNGYVALPYRNNFTEGYSTQGGSSGETYFPYYYFEDTNLVIRPTPNSSETGGIRMEYIHWPDQLVNGGDTLAAQFSPIFRSLLVAYAVYKAKLKESLVNGVALHSAAKDDLQIQYDNFRETIRRRSLALQAIIPFNPESEG